MSDRAAAIAALERRLGFSFTDRALLDRSLTHASKLGQGRSGVLHNERLEFLGDRVLGLTMAETLYERDVEAGPELLAKRYAHLVSRQVCAEIAVSVGLQDAMDVPKAQGLRRNDTVLADGCEALLAAVYLDQGLDKAKAVILDLWAQALDRPLDLEAVNPKTTLQEWALGQKKPLPAYDMVSREGPDHAPVFCISVSVEGYEPAQGQGRSRQAAEKVAAQALLEREAKA